MEKQVQGIAMSMSENRSDILLPPPPIAVANALGVNEVNIEWLAGDGSDRCYYRIIPANSDKTFVLMQLSQRDAKMIENNGYEWIQIGQILSRAGIYVPRTVATLPKYAALIIEDYGNIMLESLALEAIDKNQIDRLCDMYTKSINLVFKMIEVPFDPSSPWCQRSFDLERFEWELKFFQTHFLELLPSITLSTAQKHQFKEDCFHLSEYLNSLQKVFVHRDFHSRNLMIKDEKIAIIDFQDARLGPVAYDFVSLIFDSYVPLNEATRIDMIKKAIDTAKGQMSASLCKELEESWAPTLLQRQLKAIGSFAYLTNVKKRGNYLYYVGEAAHTLLNESVKDDRWPFLSNELPRLIDLNFS